MNTLIKNDKKKNESKFEYIYHSNVVTGLTYPITLRSKVEKLIPKVSQELLIILKKIGNLK